MTRILLIGVLLIQTAFAQQGPNKTSCEISRNDILQNRKEQLTGLGLYQENNKRLALENDWQKYMNLPRIASTLDCLWGRWDVFPDMTIEQLDEEANKKPVNTLYRDIMDMCGKNYDFFTPTIYGYRSMLFGQYGSGINPQLNISSNVRDALCFRTKLTRDPRELHAECWILNAHKVDYSENYRLFRVPVVIKYDPYVPVNQVKLEIDETKMYSCEPYNDNRVLPHVSTDFKGYDEAGLCKGKKRVFYPEKDWIVKEFKRKGLNDCVWLLGYEAKPVSAEKVSGSNLKSAGSGSVTKAVDAVKREAEKVKSKSVGGSTTPKKKQ